MTSRRNRGRTLAIACSRARLAAPTMILAVAMVLGSAALHPGPALSAPAVPGFGPPIDPLASYDGQSTCDPSPKRGTIALASLLEATYPSTGSLGIGRECGIGGRSEHKEGRAYDWAVSASIPAQASMAQDFLSWLLRPDAYGNDNAMARRLGIMYMIHDRKIWKAYAADLGWQPYDGPNPHIGHVHFSLSRDGGSAATSWHHPQGEWAATRVPPAPGMGYWLPTDRGIALNFSAPNLGGLRTQPLQRVVGMAPTPTGLGHWQVSSDGGVFTSGDAAPLGSMAGAVLNRPIVGMASTPSGKGYWLVAADGGIFSYGDAEFHGSTGSLILQRPIVGMASTASGRGYWLVAADGGIFSYGDAVFHGSTGSMTLNQPVVGMATPGPGGGYWLVASDGGIFSFGGAPFLGSTGSIRLVSPIRAMAATATGAGYWMAAGDGGVFTYGDAAFRGSAAGIGLNVVGIAPHRAVGGSGGPRPGSGS